MERKTFLKGLAAAGLGILCTGGITAMAEQASPETEADTGRGADAAPAELNMIIATDLHYISPSINDKGAYFQKVMSRADGKVTLYCEELTEAFLAEVIAQKPDVLLITGDLTFNGAGTSHEEMARKLARVQRAGIRVLVTTGNHDVWCSSAASFSGDSYTYLEQTTSDAFRNYYSAFGYTDAESADTSTLSYYTKINAHTGILVLDLNTASAPCAITESTLNWVESVLRRAQKDGVTVLAAGHQNLFQHSDLFVYGYVISGAPKLRELFERYGVSLYFSGHMHIQHRVTEGAITEIAGSALSVTPCQYGVLRLRDGKADYHTQATDVAAWAWEQGSTDRNLLSFSEHAASVMDTVSRRSCVDALKDATLSEERAAELTDYACAMNRAYFSGDLTEAASLDSDGSVVEDWSRTGSLFGYYFHSMEPEFGQNYCVLSTQIR